MIVYRHADSRFPFLWESADQPPARWHGPAEGPVQYFADTPDGAWAEFLRYEGITDESELINVRRALWVIEVPDDLAAETRSCRRPCRPGESRPTKPVKRKRDAFVRTALRLYERPLQGCSPEERAAGRSMEVYNPPPSETGSCWRSLGHDPTPWAGRQPSQGAPARTY